MKFACLLLAAFLSAAVAVAEDCVYSEYRLPHHIRPEHYDLEIGVDTERNVYEGTVKISLAVDALPHKVPENVIVLHASPSLLLRTIEFVDQTASTSSGLGQLLHKEQQEANSVESRCVDKENQLLVITMKNELKPKTQGRLEINFVAYISGDRLNGFFQNKYQDESGQWKSVVSTKFEPVWAREAFPCFDEPSFKATYDIIMYHDPKLVALSNAPIESKRQSGKYMISKFKRTPRMSTYLLAWTVGNYDYLEHVIGDGRLTIRAYALPERVSKAKFALETAVRAITLMEEFFDVPFVRDKIDMVGLPTFPSGAMENWGVIFYHDEAFLYDEQFTRSVSKGRVAYTVVHELAHQWFGNLVTMAWWNDLWLNEGFATWMQNYFTDQMYPEFEYKHQWILYDHIRGLNSDAKPGVHSIQIKETGRNLSALFNDIVYKKTGQVLRHIHDDYLGPETFREGIRKYMKKHMFGNTQAEDLWGALAEVSGLPVDRLMKSWITQPGHPEVEVELLSSGELLLKQQRTFWQETSEEQKALASQQVWMIPLSIIFADDKGNRAVENLMMESRELKVSAPEWFEPSNSNNWVKLNAGFKGFYRVKYSRDLTMRLEQPVRNKSLETSDRLNLIYDFFIDVEHKSLSHDDIVAIYSWFKDDHEGAILLLLSDAYVSINKYGPGIEVLTILLESFKAIHAKNGFEIDLGEASISDAEGLSQAFRTLVDARYEPLIEDALRYFDAKGNKNNVNIRGAIYKAVAKYGSQEQVDQLRELRKEASDQDEKLKLDIALAAVRQ